MYIYADKIVLTIGDVIDVDYIIPRRRMIPFLTELRSSPTLHPL